MNKKLSERQEKIQRMLELSPWVEHGGFRYKKIAVEALREAVLRCRCKKWR